MKDCAPHPHPTHPPSNSPSPLIRAAHTVSYIELNIYASMYWIYNIHERSWTGDNTKNRRNVVIVLYITEHKKMIIKLPWRSPLIIPAYD
jgi:hypothetical protein